MIKQATLNASRSGGHPADERTGAGSSNDSSAPSVNRNRDTETDDSSPPENSDLVTVLGVVTIVFGALKLLCGMIFPFGLAYYSNFIKEFFSELEVVSPEQFLSAVSVVILLIVFLFLIIPGILQIIGAVGVLKRRNWARILLIVLGGLDAFLALPSLVAGNPIGFLLSGGWGVFALYVLLSDPYRKQFISGG